METNIKLSDEEIIAREEAALAEQKAKAEQALPINERVLQIEGVKMYPVDVDKIQRLDDVIKLLISLDFRFSESHPSFNSVKYLLKGV